MDKQLDRLKNNPVKCWATKLVYSANNRNNKKGLKINNNTEKFIKFIIELFEKQNYKCSFCKYKFDLKTIQFDLNENNKIKKNLNNPSIDEIILGLGHSPGNVHITCLFCNLARNQNNYETYKTFMNVLLDNNNNNILDLSKDDYYNDRDYHHIDLMLKFIEKDDSITQYTFGFFLNYLEKINYKCEITGLPFFFGKNYHYLMPSFDRIDNSKPHTEDNLQLVCGFINRGKNNKTNIELLECISNRFKYKIENIEIIYPPNYNKDCIIYNLQPNVKIQQEYAKKQNKMFELLNFIKDYLEYCDKNNHQPEKKNNILGNQYYNYKNRHNKEFWCDNFEKVHKEFEKEINKYISYNEYKINKTFINNFNNLLKFYEQNKRFPEYNRKNNQNEKSLYDWFVKIKMKYNKNECSEYEIQDLNKYNFIKNKFKKSIDSVWLENYNNYIKIIEENKGIHPGQNSWAGTQRRLYVERFLQEKENKQKGKLDDERISLLEQISGWYWSETHKIYLENKYWFDYNSFYIPKKISKKTNKISNEEKKENSIYAIFHRIKNNKIKNNGKINIFDEDYLENIDIYYYYKYLSNDFKDERLKTTKGIREFNKHFGKTLEKIKIFKFKNVIKSWKSIIIK